MRATMLVAVVVGADLVAPPDPQTSPPPKLAPTGLQRRIWSSALSRSLARISPPRVRR